MEGEKPDLNWDGDGDGVARKPITVTASYGPAIVAEWCSMCDGPMLGDHWKLTICDEVTVFCPYGEGKHPWNEASDGQG